MSVEALLCPQCGGPLARPAALPAILDCSYCGAAVSISPASSTITRPGAPDEKRDAAARTGTQAFFEAMRERVGAGQDPEQALREAAEKHLGVAGQGETVARVAMALAKEFETQSGISVKKDAMVLARMAQAYLLAASELHNQPETEINLPFLSANEKGPHHFQRRVSAASLAALISGRVITEVASPAPPTSAVEDEPPKKKKWWQF